MNETEQLIQEAEESFEVFASAINIDSKIELIRRTDWEDVIDLAKKCYVTGYLACYDIYEDE